MDRIDDTYEKREQRVNDAIQLRKPDRVPIFHLLQLYPIRHCGMKAKDAYYDLAKWSSAHEETVADLKPDLYSGPQTGVSLSGKSLEAIGMRQIKWPGFNLADNASFQFVEGEYMKAEEYDAFLDDPSDFLFRTYYPRICGNLEGLGNLPSLKTFSTGFAATGALGLLALPEVKAAFDALFQAAEEEMRWSFEMLAVTGRLKEKGFPMFAGGAALVPYDLISDMLRGMRGTMIDMYRHADKLLAAQEKLLPFLIDSAIDMCNLTGVNRVFIALHRGADGFMSLEQFETFYWPDLKRLLLGLIDAGITPCPFFEGMYDERLEYLNDLPKGKILGLFDRTDLVRAKEIVGDTLCIAGGMPITLLQTGTPEQVREHTKKTIDALGRDGGYIMACSCVMDDARPDLVRAWVEATKDFGAP